MRYLNIHGYDEKGRHRDENAKIENSSGCPRADMRRKRTKSCRRVKILVARCATQARLQPTAGAAGTAMAGAVPVPRGMPRPAAVGCYKAYDSRTLAIAVDAASKMGVAAASRAYGVPQRTLYRIRVKGFSTPAPRSCAAARVISDAGEEGLIAYAKLCSKNYEPLSKVEFLQHAAKLAAKTPPRSRNAAGYARGWERAGIAGEKYWKCFKKRHPELHLLLENKMDHARAAVTQAQLDTLPAAVAALLLAYPCLKNPERWHNCDETPLQLDGGRGKVVCFGSDRSDSRAAKNARTHLTILPCVCADGSTIPPLIITRGARGATPAWLPGIADALVGTPFQRATFAQQARKRSQYLL